MTIMKAIRHFVIVILVVAIAFFTLIHLGGCRVGASFDGAVMYPKPYQSSPEPSNVLEPGQKSNGQPTTDAKFNQLPEKGGK